MRYSNHLSGINLGIFVIYNIIQIRNNAVLIINRIILLLQYRLLRSNGASVIVLI